MATTKEVKDILNRSDNVKPIAEFNGIKIVTFEDGVLLTMADAISGEDNLDLGRIMNDNGLPARSKTKYASVNPYKMFRNRVRYIKDGEKKVMQVVIDYRAISEQSTGRIYSKLIPVYEVVRNSSKKLEIRSMTQVSDNEFISEFGETLTPNAMLEIMPLIDAYGTDLTAGEIGI